MIFASPKQRHKNNIFVAFSGRYPFPDIHVRKTNRKSSKCLTWILNDYSHLIGCKYLKLKWQYKVNIEHWIFFTGSLKCSLNLTHLAVENEEVIWLLCFMNFHKQFFRFNGLLMVICTIRLNSYIYSELYNCLSFTQK